MRRRGCRCREDARFFSTHLVLSPLGQLQTRAWDKMAAPGLYHFSLTGSLTPSPVLSFWARHSLRKGGEGISPLACPSPHVWNSIQNGRDTTSKGRQEVVSRGWDGSEPFCALRSRLAWGVWNENLPLLDPPHLCLASSRAPSPQVVGCDHKLDSTEQEDKCLQCGGDGSSCYAVTGTFDANDLSRGGALRGLCRGREPTHLGLPATFFYQGLRPSNPHGTGGWGWGGGSGHEAAEQRLCPTQGPSPHVPTLVGTLARLCSLISHR